MILENSLNLSENQASSRMGGYPTSSLGYVNDTCPERLDQCWLIGTRNPGSNPSSGSNNATVICLIALYRSAWFSGCDYHGVKVAATYVEEKQHFSP